MEKQRWEESERRREAVRRSEQRRSEKKEESGARKVGKSRFTVFFQWFVAPDGWKVGSLKQRVRSQQARWEMKNCMAGSAFVSNKLRTPHVRTTLEIEMSKKWTPLWREAHFQVKSVKTSRSQTTLESWDVEKVHAVVARSAFPSQNVQSTPRSARDSAPCEKWAKSEGL